MEKARTEEEIVLEKFKGLPVSKRKMAIEFLDFLETKEKMNKWVLFDEWALNLAREKGFSHLTEGDVTKIVNSCRGQK